MPFTLEITDVQMMAFAAALRPLVALSELNPTVVQPPAPAAPQGPPQAPPQVQQPDPWNPANAPNAAPQPQAPAGSYAPPAMPQYQPPQPPATPQAVGNATPPSCVHGPMRYVPSGFSKSTGRAYSAFWGCPAPQGAADKCRSAPA